MKINQPYLIVEIKNNEIVFLVVEYNAEYESKILEVLKVKSNGFLGGKIIDAQLSTETIKKNLLNIEKKINYIFRHITLVINENNIKCINVSGFKKLSGLEIVNEDVSQILNNIKKLIIDNDSRYSLIHLFNSKFILDGIILEDLPTGLHGELYSQHLSFFLIPKNDVKNFKSIFNKCNISIERIILKPFIKGAEIIKKNNYSKNLFVLINIGRQKSSILLFNNQSFEYCENFTFGTDIIMQDVLKLCSLNEETVKNIFKNINFNTIISDQIRNEYLQDHIFQEISYRKISIMHVKNIIEARVIEIINLIYKKNINLKYIKNSKKKFLIFIEDPSFLSNLKGFFKNELKLENNVSFVEKTKDQEEETLKFIAELTGKGWEKEAIPIVHTKKSTISRIFSALFN